MSKYRAIVSITFDDDDLKELAENIGFYSSNDYGADDMLQGELDNLGLGSTWVEQIFKDGKPMIRRLSGGMMVEVSEDEE
jgi:hypothetical protein